MLCAAVSRTFVDAEGRVVFPKVTRFDVVDVGRVLIIGHVASDPAIKSIGAAIVIGDENAIVIFGIHRP